MNIETLKVFKDLIETGSFSKAAEMNYISQSAVSQQIKKLEFIFRTRLFIKKENGLQLTEPGKIFYNSSRKIVTIYNDTISGIKKDIALKNNEKLKVEAIYSAGIYVIGDYIKDFLNSNPYTQIDLQYKKYNEILDDIEKNRADFGFVACGASERKNISGIYLKEEEMVLIAPINGAPHGGEISTKEISSFKLVLFDKCSPSRKYIEKALKDKKVKINVTMEMDNIEAIKATVISGAGVSIVPSSCVRPEEPDYKYKVYRFSDMKITRPIYMVYNKKRKMSSSASAFLNKMLERKRIGLEAKVNAF
ncbi:MAG: LysR family transcriptional regulator [Elusimicrobia bacterium]|nr:LysR family transcriptional regulator [Elusimicrobiota bacterium]